MDVITFKDDEDSWERFHSMQIETQKHKNEAIRYAQKNFMDIYQKADFVQLEKETLIQILKADDLQVDKEETVFECIVTWIQENNASKSNVLNDFLKVVRLPTLSTEFIIKRVIPYCYEDILSLPYISEALVWKYVPENVKQNCRMNGRSLKLKNHFLAIGTDKNDAINNSVELYNAVNNTWRKLKDLNINARLVAAAFINNRLIIAGGKDKNNKTLNTVREVNLITGKIENLTPMNLPRSNFRLVTVGERNSSVLFAIGGNNSTGNLTSVEKWDPKLDKWTFVSSMNIIRADFAAAVLDDKIYVVGNYVPNNLPCDVEVYHVKEDRWEKKAPMKVDRGFCSGVMVGKSFYVMGGFGRQLQEKDALKTFDRYDTETDTWTTLADLSTGGCVAAGLIGNSPVALGGKWAAATVEVYDIEENKWKLLAPMNVNRDIFPVVQLPASMNDLTFDFS